MLLDLVAKITHEVEALQARGESISHLLLKVITVAYETGAESIQPRDSDSESLARAWAEGFDAGTWGKWSRTNPYREGAKE